jgi:hypothetical protein
LTAVVSSPPDSGRREVPADWGRVSYFRRLAAELLISLGVVLITLSAVLSVARRALFFSDNFADHVASSLADPRVSAFAADRITDGVLKANPDLTALRPLIVATARGAVGTTSFQALVRTAARSAHANLFSERGRRVILSVPDVGVLLKSALANANPALAEKVPRQVQGIAASIGETQVERFVVRLSRVTRRSAWLTLTLFLSGCALALGGLGLASRHRRALVRLGLDLLVAGIVLLAQRLLVLLAGNDDGAEPERIESGQEGTVGIERVPDHDVDPVEGLADSLEEPRGRRQLPFVESSLDEPCRRALALDDQGTQVLRQHRLDVEHEVEPLVDQERHRIAVVVLRHLLDRAVSVFDAHPPHEALRAVSVARAEWLRPVDRHVAKRPVPAFAEDLVPLRLPDHLDEDRPHGIKVHLAQRARQSVHRAQTQPLGSRPHEPQEGSLPEPRLEALKLRMRRSPV